MLEKQFSTSINNKKLKSMKIQ